MKKKPSRTTQRSAALLDAVSGKGVRIAAQKRPMKLSAAHVLEQLIQLKVVKKDAHKSLETYVTLSPQHPWEDDKGWLEALNPRSFFSNGSHPNMSWVPEEGQPTGYLDIWFENLEPNSLYFAQIEVGSDGTGSFDVRPVSEGASLNFAMISATAGFYQTLLAPLETVVGGLGLIRVIRDDWVFYEVTLLKAA